MNARLDTAVARALVSAGLSRWKSPRTGCPHGLSAAEAQRVMGGTERKRPWWGQGNRLDRPGFWAPQPPRHTSDKPAPSVKWPGHSGGGVTGSRGRSWPRGVSEGRFCACLDRTPERRCGSPRGRADASSGCLRLPVLREEGGGQEGEHASRTQVLCPCPASGPPCRGLWPGEQTGRAVSVKGKPLSQPAGALPPGSVTYARSLFSLRGPLVEKIRSADYPLTSEMSKQGPLDEGVCLVSLRQWSNRRQGRIANTRIRGLSLQAAISNPDQQRSTDLPLKRRRGMPSSSQGNISSTLFPL